ncbi:tRNA threonylcarbamoyladenosine biosynthesis protein RimN [Candidatus Blochmanniella chromaiodes str. 640]|uniref:Threonylcarbamoyl-AMP synthase n=1 Tax=Candidatus Blochmanniella chromaiodes str. 640 TaxID=1240471 RepID=A0ABN4AY49_9ENTR|nr:Sua5/YciO/YrdC/YwlC family protein [Candidatus Blochmannia chromaiodes]AGC03502.1 tRNA threonylcarbamoyladenosine biosynthesis protein RimN [Candidatus Blochmannia chromaiodes str. 640]
MKDLLIQLSQGKVIIYPTESVFGLGCDPDNKNAISTLLKIKNRSWKKGLILVAANYTQLLKYIDDSCLNETQRSRVFSTWPGPMTWVFPAQANRSYWLTGQFSSIAVRVSHFEPIQRLCLAFGKPLVSTSANLSGQIPARTIEEVHDQLGYKIPIMYEDILGRPNPSKIRDVMTGKLIRE